MKGDERDYSEVRDACKANRPAPVPPDEFEQTLTQGVQAEEREPGSGVKFTSGKDLTDVVIPQYKQGFLRLMAGAKLDYTGLVWGAAEAAKLAAALQYAASEGASPVELKCARWCRP